MRLWVTLVLRRITAESVGIVLVPSVAIDYHFPLPARAASSGGNIKIRRLSVARNQ